MQKQAPPADDPTAAFRVFDAEALAHNMVRLVEEGSKVWSSLLEKGMSNGNSSGNGGPLSTVNEMSEATRVLGSVAQSWVAQPVRLAQAQSELAQSYLDLWSTMLRRSMGEEVEPIARPEPGDNRFKDPDWSKNPYFDFWKQAYLISTRWAEQLVEQTEGLDERTRHRVEFFFKQMVSALSPSNFALTNPEVMRATMATSGENLVRGMELLSEDLAHSGELFKISQTDVNAFEVGRNLATTPGKVVFQNDIIQLIQYTPTTETVHEVPILIVPPWINKFYILDLQPSKSFIKYAVDAGFTVFVVSWVNPDWRLARKTFEDYMHEGILAAADAVTEATGVKKPNVLGYCVGGTLLGVTLAWLAGKRKERFRSATFLTAQMDFSKAGDLLIFIDDTQLKALEEMMAERGFLDGSRMANVFNLLRPRDLIWPYIVNNYLLGKKPIAFDLLYWNQDSTRMPAANHAFYLREFYHENRFAKGEMTIGGVRLDLGKVKLPVYELAAREDHIAPAKSVYLGARMFSGPVRYVLAGSGHIAGVVNPPEKVKYQHWTREGLGESFEEWVSGADEHPGSWWPDWIAWLARHSGRKVKARTPGEGKLKAIEDAPGSYVRQTS